MKMMRRSRSRFVTTRKVSTQATPTLAKSSERNSAPPFQTGDNSDAGTIRQIRASSKRPSKGTSRKRRLDLPILMIKPAKAKSPVSFAIGMYDRPGIQSSGRKQYTTKNAHNQKNAPRSGSFWKRSRGGAKTRSLLSVKIPSFVLDKKPCSRCPHRLTPRNKVQARHRSRKVQHNKRESDIGYAGERPPAQPESSQRT